MTLPIYLPTEFTRAVSNLAQLLSALPTSLGTAQPEDQLKRPIQDIIESSAAGVVTQTEVRLQEVAGRPDIGVKVQGLLCGYIELKAPGHGANPKKFRGRDKAQWDRFKVIPNLL